MIGIILALVAVLLAYESKGLLIGEGADPETVKNLRRLAESDPFDSVKGAAKAALEKVVPKPEKK